MKQGLPIFMNFHLFYLDFPPLRAVPVIQYLLENVLKVSAIDKIFQIPSSTAEKDEAPVQSRALRLKIDVADLWQDLDGIHPDEGTSDMHQLERVRTAGESGAGPGLLPGQGSTVLIDRTHLDIIDVDIQIATVGVTGVGQLELCARE